VVRNGGGGRGSDEHFFQPGQRYSEAEVNRMLEAFHPDTATLRRDLVGEGLMPRQGGGGEYWRVEEK